MEKFRNFDPLRVFTKSCGGFEASSIDDLRSTASSYVGGRDLCLRKNEVVACLWAVCRVLVYVHVCCCCNFYFSVWVSFWALQRKQGSLTFFEAMNEWRQPPNLRRSRSICVTKYVKRDPIRRTSLSTDFHKNQCNGSVVETPISQVGFHCFVYSYFLHCVRFMEWKWFLVPTKLTSYSCKCT